MRQRGNGQIGDELQIRFTGYLIQAVKRTQRDYLMSLYKDSTQEVLTEEIYAIGKTLEQEVMEQNRWAAKSNPPVVVLQD